jgi:hypothetical protein
VRRRYLALLGSIGLLLGLAAPAGAIVYGEPTGPNQFTNVGTLVSEFDVNGETLAFQVCTGTLIDDGDGDDRSELFLTAAHCIFADEVWVSFDHDLVTDPAKFGSLVPGANTLLPGTPIAHPSFACCGANDTFDIAVVVLGAEVQGDPAPIADLGLLYRLSNAELRTAEFTTAGYGAVRETRKTGWQALTDPEGVRSWATQSALSLTKSWLTLSMNQATDDGGTCFGDSGGPHFLGDTVVSITVTGDVNCKATDKTYRIDTPVAQDFLAPILAAH